MIMLANYFLEPCISNKKTIFLGFIIPAAIDKVFSIFWTYSVVLRYSRVFLKCHSVQRADN